MTSAKLVAVVANGPGASGLAWPVTDHSQNWARAAFGISGRSPTKKAGSAHIVGCPSAIALFPSSFVWGWGEGVAFLLAGNFSTTQDTGPLGQGSDILGEGVQEKETFVPRSGEVDRQDALARPRGECRGQEVPCHRHSPRSSPLAAASSAWAPAGSNAWFCTVASRMVSRCCRGISAAGRQPGNPPLRPCTAHLSSGFL